MIGDVLDPLIATSAMPGCVRCVPVLPCCRVRITNSRECLVMDKVIIGVSLRCLSGAWHDRKRCGVPFWPCDAWEMVGHHDIRTSIDQRRRLLANVATDIMP